MSVVDTPKTSKATSTKSTPSKNTKEIIDVPDSAEEEGWDHRSQSYPPWYFPLSRYGYEAASPLDDHKTSSVTMGKDEPTIKKKKAGSGEPMIKKERGVKRQIDDGRVWQRRADERRRKELQYWSEKTAQKPSSKRI